VMCRSNVEQYTQYTSSQYTIVLFCHLTLEHIVISGTSNRTDGSHVQNKFNNDQNEKGVQTFR
jgi:hypothetical protein